MSLDSLSDIILKAKELKEEDFKKECEEILNTVKSGDNHFKGIINDSEELYHKGGLKTLSTGFNVLDDVIGGLRSGLYIVGAISSLGKTTFIHQIADTISAEKPVLFFSLEMSTKELVAKTITRESYKLDNKFNISSTKLLDGKFNKKDFDILEKVKSKKNKFENIYYYEGTFNTNIDTIKEKARALTSVLGVSPVIIVDYLQIITPSDLRMSDKQSTDKNISELKRLSRDLDTSIIAISSLNRESYSSPVSFSSFKESGSIEYGADVVIALDFKIMDYILNNLKDDKDKNKKNELIKKAREQDPREIYLNVLKNRFGKSSSKIEYKYYPIVSYFEEVDDLTEVTEVDSKLDDWIDNF